MLFYLVVLHAVERPRLLQHAVGNADFAYVVKQRREAHLLDERAPFAHRARDLDAYCGDTVGMVLGVGVLGVYGARERRYRAKRLGAAVQVQLERIARHYQRNEEEQQH
ncbi:hypothetical protein SDC9_167333 [bioreactor metagenome]|uniref:Uncharacterized protein n=1 Tax=bioreactor metagenome TaxID=1076179 RepID=A0A645FZG7_9ZZZZ